MIVDKNSAGSSPTGSSPLFSTEGIENNLAYIFEDSIILSTRFRIVRVSPSILQLLNYGSEQLLGQPIDLISRDHNWQKSMEAALQPGFFRESEYIAQTRNGHSLVLGISGFYLGLISDINGYIILRVRNLNELRLIYEQLREKALELDYFLYRTSHDLRGPLASLMGLLSIMPLAETEEEKAHYIAEMTRCAEKTDATLKNLLYVAQADRNDFAYDQTFHPDRIEAMLRQTIHGQIHNGLRFEFECTSERVPGMNVTLLISLLKNLVIALLELPPDRTERALAVRLHSATDRLTIELCCTGFSLEASLARQITQKNLPCAEILKNGPLVRFYAARKILERLKGSIQPVIDALKPMLLITIPYPPVE